MDPYQSLEQKLDAVHKWPCEYTFKFIVAADQCERLLGILPPGQIDTKASSTNRYTSVTLRASVDNAQEVIQVYKKTAEIPGLMAL